MKTKKFIAVLSLTALFLTLSGVTFAEDTGTSSLSNTVQATVSVLAVPTHTADETVIECLKTVRITHLTNNKIVREAFESAMSAARGNFKTAMNTARSAFETAKTAAKVSTEEADRAAMKIAREAYLTSVRSALGTFRSAVKVARDNFAKAKSDEQTRYESDVIACRD